MDVLSNVLTAKALAASFEEPKCQCHHNSGEQQLQQHDAIPSTSRTSAAPIDVIASPPPPRIVPDGQETALLTHHYQICDLIEKGPICTVYRALHRSTGRSHTVKSLDLKRFCAVSGLSQEDAEKEVEICASLKHAYFVQLNDVISGNNALHMVFEWIEGEDICFEVVRRAAAGFIYSEAVASHYTRQLVEAVRYMHSLNIVHRDIRPHNLLLANKENNAPLKVRGLGLAYRLPSDDNGAAACPPGRIGVPQFMAPEVVAGTAYGKAADMWSVGVILYVLLCGRVPFVGRPDEVFQQICGAHYSVSDPIWTSISEPAKDLLGRLLRVDVQHRATPEQCLRHEWLRKTVPARVHLSETIENVRRYNARRRLKSNIVSSVNNARLNNNNLHPKLAASPSYFGAQSLPGGDSCDFECLPATNYDNNANVGGQANRTQIAGVERVLFSLDQMSVLTDCVAGVQHQQQLLDQALNDRDLHQLLLLYDRIRTESVRPAPVNRAAERALREARKELQQSVAGSSSAAAELLELLDNVHLQAILQSMDVTAEEVFTPTTMCTPATTPAAANEATNFMTGQFEAFELAGGGIASTSSDAMPNSLPNGAVCTGSAHATRPQQQNRLPSSMLRPTKTATLAEADEECCSDAAAASGPLPGDDDDLVLSAINRVRLVQFSKDTEEPMGITLKITEDGRCYVGRIMHGGLIHRQATLHVDDEILEINGVSVANRNVEQLQRLLRDARGAVTFKIVPSYRSAPPACEIFCRAQFDYDPAQDDLIPCPSAGVPFQTGDILQVISKDDHNWWQARFVCPFPALGGSSKWSSSTAAASAGGRCSTTASASGTICGAANAVASTSAAALANHTGGGAGGGGALQKHPKRRPPFAMSPSTLATTTATAAAANMAGLIPSPELQEWRTACLAMERARENSHCFMFSKKKSGSSKYYTTKYLRKHSELFDGMEMISYEEVIRLATFRRKTLVLLGAHGVGRRHIKNTLIRLHPHRFAYPIPHTTRPPRRDEIDGKHYYFVPNDAMLADIQANEYLEYGTHEECLYGTKLETIRAIHRTGKMAILDVEPQALKVLRNAEYAPFVVFIGAPDLHGLQDPDGSLERLVKESELLRQSFGHLFDFVLINNDIDDTIRQLESVVEKLSAIPQWVPVSWVY
ncbi:hypothetical protein GPALN_014473 [Globodera pallida]|nr:hypothetical protein GPALN_014473 [Globodera pallida]